MNVDGMIMIGIFVLNCFGWMWFDYDDLILILIVLNGMMVVMEDSELEIIDCVLIGLIFLVLILLMDLNVDEDVEVLSII